MFEVDDKPVRDREDRLRRLRIERQREEVLDGVPVTRYDFLELTRPAIVRQRDTDKDLPSSGSIWVERATDRVVKTTIRTGDDRFRMEATVSYKPADGMSLLVPSEMSETHRMVTAVETTYGTAK